MSPVCIVLYFDKAFLFLLCSIQKDPAERMSASELMVSIAFDLIAF
jgi:hypothetical protein